MTDDLLPRTLIALNMRPAATPKPATTHRIRVRQRRIVEPVTPAAGFYCGQIVQRDDGLYSLGWHDEAPGPFESYSFAAAVAAGLPERLFDERAACAKLADSARALAADTLRADAKAFTLCCRWGHCRDVG